MHASYTLSQFHLSLKLNMAVIFEFLCYCPINGSPKYLCDVGLTSLLKPARHVWGMYSRIWRDENGFMTFGVVAKANDSRPMQREQERRSGHVNNKDHIVSMQMGFILAFS